MVSADDSAFAIGHRSSLSFGMSAQLFLAASVGALASGPLVSWGVDKRPALMSFLDGFIVVSIGGLVLLDVVPHALQSRDVLAFVFIALGFVLPSMAERLLHYGARQTHTAVLALALVGVALHSALDGSALKRAGDSAQSLLGYGVLLHQIPVSLMVWWVLRDRPRLIAWAVLLLMAIMTVVGFAIEPELLTRLPERAGLWFEALIGGSLLHVIGHAAHDSSTDGHAHNHTHDHSHEHGHAHSHAHAHGPALQRANRTNGVGALLGAALLILLHVTRSGERGFALDQTIENFWRLSLDSAPAILLAYVAAGLIHAFLPVSSLAWMSRGSRVRQGLAGMAVGLPLPICSCSVVPLYQQLVQQGASSTAAIAFLVATPELGIDAVLLSVPLLGTEFAAVRVGAAAFAALSVALVMGRLARTRSRALPQAMDTVTALPMRSRLQRAARAGLGDMVDHTGPWILAGIVMAALAMPILQNSWLTRLPVGVDVVAFALIGLPLYICASASTPLVAVLVAAGVSPGAGLALLLTGPATNIATLGVLTRMHGRHFAVWFAVAMTTCAIVLGLLTNLLLPSLADAPMPIEVAQEETRWQLAAVVAVAGLYAASIIRRGIRGFLGELRLAEAS